MTFALAVSVVAPNGASAADPATTSTPAPTSTAKRAKQRLAVEALLDQDVEWDVGDKQFVTIEEFIAHVRQKHGLSIRWDTATLQAMFGGSSGSHSATTPVTILAPDGSSSDEPQALSPNDGALYAAPSSSNATSPYPATAAPAVIAPSVPVSPGPAATPSASPVPASVVPAAIAPTAAPSTTASSVPSPAIAPSVSPSAVAPLAPSAAATAPLGESPNESPSEGPTAPSASPSSSADVKAAASEEIVEEERADFYLHFAHTPIPLASLALEDATVGETLQHLLAAAAPEAMEMDSDFGMPIGTRALTLDYLVEGRSVVITTRMQAHFRKETRVYSIAHLKSLSPEDLARVITHSVRPWSWRTQAPEIAARMATAFPKGGKIALPTMNFNVTDGVQLTSNVTTVSDDSSSDDSPDDSSSDAPSESTTTIKTAESGETIDAETMQAIGGFLANSAVAMWEAGLATVEMLYHGEPPTGQIEVLPGVLIINQSQSAHREIADLLEQLKAAQQAASDE